MSEDQLTGMNMVLNAFGLTGKVVIVTGYDTGLGQGMMLGLAQTGYGIVGINRKIPHDTATQVQALDRRFHTIWVDPSRQDEMSVLVDQAVAAIGRVDILVNDTGIIRRYDALTFMESDWDAVIDLNLRAVFFLSQAVVRQLIRRGDGGRITSIASTLSSQGGIRIPSYTASKSGALGLARPLTNKWVGQRINVNVTVPGYMAINNIQALHGDEERNQAILRHIPAGRWGEPKGLRGSVVSLASVAADYINGYTLAIDGG